MENYVKWKITGHAGWDADDDDSDNINDVMMFHKSVTCDEILALYQERYKRDRCLGLYIRKHRNPKRISIDSVEIDESIIVDKIAICPKTTRVITTFTMPANGETTSRRELPIVVSDAVDGEAKIGFYSSSPELRHLRNAVLVVSKTHKQVEGLK